MGLDAANQAVVSFLKTPGAQEIFFDCDTVREHLIDIFSTLPILESASPSPKRLSADRLSKYTFEAIQNVLSDMLNVSKITTVSALFATLYEEYFIPENQLPSSSVSKELFLVFRMDALELQQQRILNTVSSMKTLDTYMENYAMVQDLDDLIVFVKKQVRHEIYEELGLSSSDGNDEIILNGPIDLSRLLNHTKNKENPINPAFNPFVSSSEESSPKPTSVPVVPLDLSKDTKKEKNPVVEETLDWLEKRPKNELYLAICTLCSSLTKDRVLVKELAVCFLVHLWTLSLREDFVVPSRDEFSGWLSQKLQTLFRTTRIDNFQSIKSFVPQLIFPKDGFPCTPQQLFDDLEAHFRPVYNDYFSKIAQPMFDEHFVRGKKLTDVNDAFYPEGSANNAHTQVNLALKILRDNALTYKEIPFRKEYTKTKFVPQISDIVDQADLGIEKSSAAIEKGSVVEEIPVVIEESSVYPEERLLHLEKRPKNDLYAEVCRLCFPLVEDELSAERLSAGFLVHLWTLSLGNGFSFPNGEEWNVWLSQKLQSFLKETSIVKLPPIASRSSSIAFGQNVFSCSAQQLLDDLESYFHPFYEFRFLAAAIARRTFDEYFINGMSVEEIKIKHYPNSGRGSVQSNLRAVQSILQESAITYKEFCFRGSLVKQKFPGFQSPSSRGISDEDIKEKERKDTTKYEINLPYEAKRRGRKPKPKPDIQTPSLPKRGRGRPKGSTKKQAPKSSEIKNHVQQKQESSVVIASSESQTPMLPVIATDFNGFHQKLGKKFPPLYESDRKTDPHTLICAYLKILAGVTDKQRFEFRQSLYAKKIPSAKRPTWYTSFLGELYLGITNKGHIIYPDKALFAPPPRRVKSSSGRQQFEGEERNFDVATFIQKRLRILNNMAYPFVFVVTEASWKAEKETILKQWEKYLKSSSLKPGSLGVFITKLVDFSQECREDFACLIWFRDFLSKLQHVSAQYPHTLSQPVHLPENIIEIEEVSFPKKEKHL